VTRDLLSSAVVTRCTYGPRVKNTIRAPQDHSTVRIVRELGRKSQTDQEPLRERFLDRPTSFCTARVVALRHMGLLISFGQWESTDRKKIKPRLTSNEYQTKCSSAWQKAAWHKHIVSATLLTRTQIARLLLRLTCICKLMVASDRVDGRGRTRSPIHATF
jgi:hypothetical protein